MEMNCCMQHVESRMLHAVLIVNTQYECCGKMNQLDKLLIDQ